MRLRRGFTLIEVIVAAGIASFILFVGYLAIGTSISASTETQSRMRDTENARLFFDQLRRDFATAKSGPGGITKDHAVITGSPTTFPSTLAVNETIVPNATPPSDILQFYCSAGASGTEQYFVRYYVNQIDHTLCREARPIPQPPAIYPPPTGFYETNPPVDNSSDLTHWALFEGVRTLNIVFERWDATLPNPRYFGETTIPPNQPVACDTIVVTLTFTDPLKLKELQQNHSDVFDPNHDQPGAAGFTKFDNASSRTFSTTVPIPTTF